MEVTRSREPTSYLNGQRLSRGGVLESAQSQATSQDQWRPLTVQFSDCTLQEFMRIAADFGTIKFAYVVTPNTDHLIRYCDDDGFRDLYRAAGFVLLDSRFLAYMLRLFKGVRIPTAPGSDVTERLFADIIAPDDKIIVVGGTEEQAATLSDRYGLRGLRHINPPMGFIDDPVAIEACLSFIESEAPFRFCLLAVGCPQQEILAKALQARGRARGLALCIGASINFLTGRERRAPKWVQIAGLEWFHRLMHNPSRMARRYLIRGPRIFFLLPRLKIMLKALSPGTSPGR
jgi:exopolysaccharide biosynthesis WecB/TagA/CpsF family protein